VLAPLKPPAATSLFTIAEPAMNESASLSESAFVQAFVDGS